MRAIFSIAILIASLLFNSTADAATNPERFIKEAASALTTGQLSIFTPAIRKKIIEQAIQSQVRQAGAINSIAVEKSVRLHNGYIVQGRTSHALYVIHWTVGYSSQSQLIEALEVQRIAKLSGFKKDLGINNKFLADKSTSDMFEKTITDFNVAKKSEPSARPTISEPSKPYEPKVRTSRKRKTAKKTFSKKSAGSGGGYVARTAPSAPMPNSVARADRPRPTIVPTTTVSGITPIPSTEDAVCKKFPALCQHKEKDVRSVEFLFATTRAESPSTTMKISFSGSRATKLTFGAARVRIPEKHEIGQIELPEKIGFWGYTIYETKEDETKHFTIKSVVKLDEQDWGDLIKSTNSKEALIFVHGYNTTFEDALYRNAQIIWDLQYKRGPSILFTWASKGQALDYIYDQQSALLARAAFLKLLKMLRDDYKIEKINVLAHSMGNLIVLDALADEERTQNPVRISELVLAAPDVDRDYFLQVAPKVRKITAGMTLYCSATDKAMIASRELASAPRAGDVPPNGPIIVPDIDTIDVTALGQEFLGLNHDVFAADRSVMNDIKVILTSGIRPPDARSEVRGVPEGSDHPKYWRYPN